MAKQKAVTETKDGWLVKSQSGRGFYRVSDTFVCDCPDSEFHNTTCKHAYAVRYYLDIEKHTPEGIENEKIRLTYKQAWSVYNEAQVQEGRLFDGLLSDLVSTIASPVQTRGRPRLMPREAAFVAIKKIYSGMSSRRAASLFGDSADRGYILHEPNFNSVSKFLNQEETGAILQELIKITSAPLKDIETNFAVDSTGFRTTSFGIYAEDKYGTKKERKWLKAHICCGTKTNIITSVKILGEHSADCPNFAALTQETSDAGFKINEVYADKAYLSRDNLMHITKLGGTPYIPFKIDSTMRARGAQVWRRMFLYFQLNQEEFMKHYNQRSNVESTIAAVKKKLGETLRSKNRTAQINELLCKLIAYNITVLIHEMKELGIEPIFAKGGLV